MTHNSAFPEPPEWLSNLNLGHLKELSARDSLHGLGLDFDIEFQLEAIQHLLRRNTQSESSHAERIRQAEEKAKRLSGIWNEYATDEYVSLMNESLFKELD